MKLQRVIIWLLGVRRNQNQVCLKKIQIIRNWTCWSVNVIKHQFSLLTQIIPPDAVCQCHQRADFSWSSSLHFHELWRHLTFLFLWFRFLGLSSSKRQMRELLWTKAWTHLERPVGAKKKWLFRDFLLQTILHFHIIAPLDPAASNSIYSLNWEALQWRSSDWPTLAAVLKAIL